MARGTSVHFKGVKNLRHEDLHNRREGREPRYLLPKEHRLRDSRGQIVESVMVRDDPGLHARYMARLAQCSERAKRAKAFSPFWSGVVVLPFRDTGNAESVEAYRDRLAGTMTDWCQAYEALTGHEVLQCALHFDEGWVDEDGVHLNPHAHVLVDRMREREAHVIKTKTGERCISARVNVIELDRQKMREVQDMTCRVVNGESADGRRARVAAERAAVRHAGLPPRGHINHREYRALVREISAHSREHQREGARVLAERDAACQEIAAARGVMERSARYGAGGALDPRVKLPEAARQLDAAWQRAAETLQDRWHAATRDMNEARKERDQFRGERDEARRETDAVRFASETAARAAQRLDSELADEKAAHPEKIAREDIARARLAIESHARARGLPLDEGYKSLRADWIAENEREARAGRSKPHSQKDYSALKLAQLEIEAERHAVLRERAKRKRDRQVQAERARTRGGVVIGGRLTAGYRSAEIAAARACGLHYEWDVVARCRRYRDRAGRELFTATRTRVELVRHDEAAETAALRIAAARFGGVVSLTGSGEFRERLARQATREGIRVVDADLAGIVEDERARIARREPAQRVHANPGRVARIERLNPSHRELIAWWQRIGGHERREWLQEADRQGRKAEHSGDRLMNAWHTMRDCADGGREVPESIAKAREWDRARVRVERQAQPDEPDLGR